MEDKRSEIIGDMLKQIPCISEVECFEDGENDYYDNQFFIDAGDGPDGGIGENDIIGSLYRMAASIYGTMFYVYLFDGRIRAFLAYNENNYDEVDEYIIDLVCRFKPVGSVEKSESDYITYEDLQKW